MAGGGIPTSLCQFLGQRYPGCVQLEDIHGFEEREEALAVEMAAAAAVAGRLDVLDRSFLLALDYMLQEANRQKDSQVTQCTQPVHLMILLYCTVLRQGAHASWRSLESRCSVDLRKCTPSPNEYCCYCSAVRAASMAPGASQEASPAAAREQVPSSGAPTALSHSAVCCLSFDPTGARLCGHRARRIRIIAAIAHPLDSCAPLPCQVEVLSMLVTTPKMEARLDIIRRSVAAASLGANRAQLEAQVAAQENSAKQSEGNSDVGSANGGTGSSTGRSLGGSGSSTQSVEALSSFPDAPIPVSDRSGPQGLVPQSPSKPGAQTSVPQGFAGQRSSGAPGRPSLRRGIGGMGGESDERGGEGEEEDEEGDGARGPAAVWEEYAPEEAWDLDRGSEDESEGERKRRKVKRRVPAAPLQLIVAQADDIVAVSELGPHVTASLLYLVMSQYPSHSFRFCHCNCDASHQRCTHRWPSGSCRCFGAAAAECSS